MSNAIPAANVKLKRSYDPAADADGTRYLVDRLWPRGIGTPTDLLTAVSLPAKHCNPIRPRP